MISLAEEKHKDERMITSGIAPKVYSFSIANNMDVTAKTPNTSDDNDVIRFTFQKIDSNGSNEHEHFIFMDNRVGMAVALENI